MSAASALSYGVGQCTRFVAQSVEWVFAGWGDAYQWTGNAQKAGLKLGPATLGAVAVWQPGQGGALSAGHVAEVVGFQDNGLPIIQEENWGPDTGPGGRSVGYNNPDTRALTRAEATSAQYITPPSGAPLPAQMPAALLGGHVDTAFYGLTDGSKTSGTQGGLNIGPLNLPTPGQIAGAVTDPLAGLAGAVVSGLGTALGGMVAVIGSGIANFLAVSVEDLYAFVSNHVLPLAVAGVVTAALFA
jgi:surface antigen